MASLLFSRSLTVLASSLSMGRAPDHSFLRQKLQSLWTSLLFQNLWTSLLFQICGHVHQSPVIIHFKFHRNKFYVNYFGSFSLNLHNFT